MHDVAKVSELFDTDLWALDFWYLRGSHGVTGNCSDAKMVAF